MRLKEIYQRNKPILQLYFLFTLLVIGTWFLTAWFLMAEGFSTTSENINKEVSSTFINGILTVTAIIFGFISFEIRRFYQQSLLSILVVIFPILASLIIMAQMYFTSTILHGYPTVGTAFWVFVLFVSATIYSLALLFAVAVPRKERIADTSSQPH
jgi:hypothetical protein